MASEAESLGLEVSWQKINVQNLSVYYVAI